MIVIETMHERYKKRLKDTLIQSSSPFFDWLSVFVEGLEELVEFRRPKESCPFHGHGHNLFYLVDPLFSTSKKME